MLVCLCLWLWLCLCVCVVLAMRRTLSSIRRDLNGHTQVFAQSPPPHALFLSRSLSFTAL